MSHAGTLRHGKMGDQEKWYGLGRLGRRVGIAAGALGTVDTAGADYFTGGVNSVDRGRALFKLG